MLGAIIGDIVGSVYEWHNIKTKDFPLFRDDCRFTDDTVMTCAVAEAIMNGGEKDDFIDAMKKYGRMFPDAGYGGLFRNWLFTDDREPYNSFGNGSAMRVSPCAWMMDCGFCARTGMWPSNGRSRAQLSADVTHNHPEGIKGAMAVTDAIFMSRFYFICRNVSSAAIYTYTSAAFGFWAIASFKFLIWLGDTEPLTEIKQFLACSTLLLYCRVISFEVSLSSRKSRFPPFLKKASAFLPFV
mgnify:CR=1 FL=1